MGSCCAKEDSNPIPTDRGIVEPIYTGDSDDEDGVVKNPIVPDAVKPYSPPPAADPISAPRPVPFEANESHSKSQMKQVAQRRRSSISLNGKEVVKTVEVNMTPMSTGGKFGRSNVAMDVNYDQCVDKMADSVIGKSLLSPMLDSEVYRRGWAEKRGHMVKNWKKRWFVVDKTEIRYYVKEKEAEPFGDGLKGQVSIVFATIESVVEKDDKGNTIDVVVVRNSDKDLFLTFAEAEEADAWVRSTREAIRRASIEFLEENPLQLLAEVNTCVAIGAGDVSRATTSSRTSTGAGDNGLSIYTYKGEEWYMGQRLAIEQTLLGAYFTSGKGATRRGFRCRKHGFSADSKRNTLTVEVSFYFSHVDWDHDRPPVNCAEYGRALSNCPSDCAGLTWTVTTPTTGSSSGKVSFADITDVFSGKAANIKDSEATLSIIVGKLSYCIDLSAESAANGHEGVFRDFTQRLITILQFYDQTAKCNHFSTGKTSNPKNKKALMISAQRLAMESVPMIGKNRRLGPELS